MITRQRHLECLERGMAALQRTVAAMGYTKLDVCSMELEEALHCLGEILGRDVELSVLDRIFDEFCIGK